MQPAPQVRKIPCAGPSPTAFGQACIGKGWLEVRHTSRANRCAECQAEMREETRRSRLAKRQRGRKGKARGPEALRNDEAWRTNLRNARERLRKASAEQEAAAEQRRWANVMEPQPTPRPNRRTRP